MAQMNVSIPEKLKGWAEQRVAEGRYSSTSDYIRDLVRRDQEQEEKRQRLQAAIDEGLASGVSERDPFDYVEELRAGLRARAGKADAAEQPSPLTGRGSGHTDGLVSDRSHPTRGTLYVAT
jgi:antitoxin ParD1/3/4